MYNYEKFVLNEIKELKDKWMQSLSIEESLQILFVITEKQNELIEVLLQKSKRITT